MDKMKILEKVQKILSRADSNQNDNEHEREIAMRQAQALLTKYSLTIADCEQHQATSALGDRIESLHDRPVRRKYVNAMYGAAAKLNDCEIVISSYKGAKGCIRIIGRELNVEITQRMFEYLYNSVRNESKRSYLHEKEIAREWGSLDTLPSPAKWNDSFCLGAAYGIANQVRSIIAKQKHGDINGEIISKSQALVLVDFRKKELVENKSFIQRKYGNLEAETAAKASCKDGYTNGRQFGENVSLNKQIDSTKRVGLLN